MIRLLALSLGLLLAGCVVGPNYQRPALDLPAAFGEPDVGATAMAVPQKWWMLYGDETLNDVMRRKSKLSRAYLAGELFAGYASPDGLGRAAVAQARRPPRRAR